MKLAVFIPNWIGDAVMATPALRALRTHFGPGSETIGVLRWSVAQALAGTPLLDRSLLYEPRSTDRRQRNWGLVGLLRRERIDLAVLLTNSLRTAALAWLGNCRQRVGYDRYWRGKLLTRRVAPPRGTDGALARTPMVDYYLELAYAAGCGPESPRLELATLPADEAAADAVWEQFGLREGRVLILNCSGAFGGSKLWPVEHFAVLARRAAGELDCDVLAICGPGEREQARRIVAQAGHCRVFSLAESPLSIGLSKACVRRGRLMVSTDSGPRHFAVAFGVPLVTLFGPTPPVWGLNPTARETALMRDDLECFGCHRRTCPLGHHRCLRDLPVDRVFAAVAAQLSAADRTAA